MLYITTADIDVEALDSAALDVRPLDRDWSEGYPEAWDYAKAPDCPQCGTYCRWADGDDFLSALEIDADAWRDGVAEAEDAADAAEGSGAANASDLRDKADKMRAKLDRIETVERESWPAWRCPDQDCDDFGQEVDPHDSGAEGPMMNYAYPLPDLPGDMEESAYAIRDLPLCIVRRKDDGSYELALTGGGMDLSWEICEAFMRLGFLPPAHFADLPGMAGRGAMSSAGEDGALISERDAKIIAACRRTADLSAESADATADSLTRALDRVEGKPSAPYVRTVRVPADLAGYLAEAMRDGLHTGRGEPFTRERREAALMELRRAIGEDVEALAARYVKSETETER